MGTVPCEVAVGAKFDKTTVFGDTPVRVTSSGVLHIEHTQHPLALDLTLPGTALGEPKTPRTGRPFIV